MRAGVVGFWNPFLGINTDVNALHQIQEFRVLAGRDKRAASRAQGLGKLRISRADSTLKARGASARAGNKARPVQRGSPTTFFGLRGTYCHRNRVADGEYL
jgi:hypothetical protein